MDPLAGDYSFYTPYQYAGNMPVNFIDLDGKEPADPATYNSATDPILAEPWSDFSSTRNLIMVLRYQDASETVSTTTYQLRNDPTVNQITTITRESSWTGSNTYTKAQSDWNVSAGSVNVLPVPPTRLITINDAAGNFQSFTPTAQAAVASSLTTFRPLFTGENTSVISVAIDTIGRSELEILYMQYEISSLFSRLGYKGSVTFPAPVPDGSGNETLVISLDNTGVNPWSLQR